MKKHKVAFAVLSSFALTLTAGTLTAEVSFTDPRDLNVTTVGLDLATASRPSIAPEFPAGYSMISGDVIETSGDESFADGNPQYALTANLNDDTGYVFQLDDGVNLGWIPGDPASGQATLALQSPVTIAGIDFLTMFTNRTLGVFTFEYSTDNGATYTEMTSVTSDDVGQTAVFRIGLVFDPIAAVTDIRLTAESTAANVYIGEIDLYTFEETPISFSDPGGFGVASAGLDTAPAGESRLSVAPDFPDGFSVIDGERITTSGDETFSDGNPRYASTANLNDDTGFTYHLDDGVDLGWIPGDLDSGSATLSMDKPVSLAGIDFLTLFSGRTLGSFRFEFSRDRGASFTEISTVVNSGEPEEVQFRQGLFFNPILGVTDVRVVTDSSAANVYLGEIDLYEAGDASITFTDPGNRSVYVTGLDKSVSARESVPPHFNEPLVRLDDAELSATGDSTFAEGDTRYASPANLIDGTGYTYQVDDGVNLGWIPGDVDAGVATLTLTTPRTVEGIDFLTMFAGRSLGDFLFEYSDDNGTSYTEITTVTNEGVAGVFAFRIGLQFEPVGGVTDIRLTCRSAAANVYVGEIDLLVAVADSDGDGMPDDFEDQYGLDKNDASDAASDADGDQLTNLEEFAAKTDPTMSDSDSDGLSDGVELSRVPPTDPLTPDTDGDGRSDGDEVNGDPTTDPLVADTDGDGRSDGEEIVGPPVTDPNDPDTDGDGFSDGVEVARNTDPNDANDVPEGLPPVVHFDAMELAEVSDGDSVVEWGGQEAVGDAILRQAATPNGSPAVELDGFSNFGQAEVDASTSNDFIVVAVVKPDSIGAYHNIVDDDESNGPMLWIDGADEYELNFGGGDSPLTGETGSDGWDVVIADSRNGNLYINSATPNGSAGRLIEFNAAEEFDFFHRDDNQGFVGLVAELRIYNDAGAFGGSFAALYSELVVKWFMTDSDGDGMPDDFENEYGFDENDAADAILDADGDGLSNVDEFVNGTKPTAADTDEDGLSDGLEIAGNPATSPTVADTDGDGLTDGEEVNGDPGSNPTLADTDGDGLSDSDEVKGNPATNPLLVDTDADGYGDKTERRVGTDPTDAASFPDRLPPVIQFDALTLSGGDGTIVEDWGGVTPLGEPVLRLGATPNGGPAVEFDGFATLDQALLEASESGDLIIAAVIKPEALGAYHNLVDDLDRNRPMLWIDAGDAYELNFGGGESPLIGETGTAGWDIVIADSKANELYVNSPTANGRGGGAVPFLVDEEFSFLHRDGGQSYTGQLAELIIYNDVAAFDGDFASLYANLASKWIEESDEGFAIKTIVRDPQSGAITLTWASQPGRLYLVRASDSLIDPWDEIDDEVESEGSETSFTDSSLNPSTKLRYYQIVEQ